MNYSSLARIYVYPFSSICAFSSMGELFSTWATTKVSNSVCLLVSLLSNLPFLEALCLVGKWSLNQCRKISKANFLLFLVRQTLSPKLSSFSSLTPSETRPRGCLPIRVTPKGLTPRAQITRSVVSNLFLHKSLSCR